MGGFRILHTADSHIGADLPAKRTTRRRRGDDFVDSFGRVLDAATGGGADLVVHAGDVFDRSTPTPAAMSAAESLLHKTAAAGVPIVIVPGNHERSRIPSSLLLSHPNIRIAREPCTFSFSLRGRRVAVAAFPFVRNEPAAAFAEMVSRTGWEKANAEVNVLAAHQTFESATCGPANFRFRSSEDVVERDAVPPGFDYVAAGHIHRHQVLETCSGGPPIVYAGSPDRITFAEMNEPKGYVLIEESGGGLAHRFVEHAVRPMCIVPVDVSGMAHLEVREHITRLLAELPRDAITQIRLSGNTSASAVRGLRLTQLAGELRPDINASISFQAVELSGVARPKPSIHGRTVSAFDALDAPVSEIAVAAPDDLKPLPAGHGTYAFYDIRGRLLYIGKSNRLRARVRSHIRDGAKGHFAGWTRQIARVEARPAASDPEALLVEADLVRRWKPPFNRQMRLWSRYWYLAAWTDATAELVPVREQTASRRCFGPFSSKTAARHVAEAVSTLFKTAWCEEVDAGGATRHVGGPCTRYLKQQCTGPCAGHVHEHPYRDQLAARDAFLCGRDDASLVALEAQIESRRESSVDDERLRLEERTAQLLRFTFNRQVTSRKAAALLGALLILPGNDGGRTAAAMTPRGLFLKRLSDSGRSATSLLRWHARMVAAPMPVAGCCLPKTIADCLCTAARLVGKHRSEIGVLDMADVRSLDARRLREIAFGERTKPDAASGKPCADEAAA